MIYASFDIDGTILYSMGVIESELKKLGYIIDQDRRDGFNLNFLKGYCPPEYFLWDLFFYRVATERWQDYVPADEFVVKFINDLYKISGRQPIRCITTRPRGPFIHHCTCLSLKSNFPGVDFSVDVVENSREKNRYMYSTEIIFEDRRSTAIEMSALGYIVFLRRQTYNRIDQTVKNHKPIEDILSYHEIHAGDIVTFDNYGQINNKRFIDWLT